MTLIDDLQRIAGQIEQQKQLMRGEQATINVSVHPYIRALGYDTNNLAEVFPEYSADAKSKGGESVDYAIMRDGKPIIFIEAKSASTKLNDTHWKQLYNYFNAKDVRIGILTNGLEYRFYADLKKSHIMDKQPFMTIDMLNLDERSVAALQNFTKSHFDITRIVDFAQRQEIVKLLQQEMDNPSDALVDHFARELHHGRMSASVRQHYRALLREAWREMIDMEIASSLQRHCENGENEDEDSGPTPANGAAIVPIYLKYKGKVLAKAKMHYPPDRKLTSLKVVRLEERMWTVSGSAKYIVHQIADTKVAVLAFSVWKLNDPLNGQERSLYDLRENAELQMRVFQKYGS